MRLSALARDLYDEISELTIIDAHEHLPPEKDYISYAYSGLNMFAGYIRLDLESAGLSSEFVEKMRDPNGRPVDEWWPTIKPYWQQAKNGSYARALRITARDLFGIDDIDDSTIHQLAEKVVADNKPGLYQKIIQDRCNIRYSLTDVERASFPEDPGLLGLTRPAMVTRADHSARQMLSLISDMSERPIKKLDDAVEALQSQLRGDLRDGAVGFKTMCNQYGVPDPAAAEEELKHALGTSEDPGFLPALRAYLFDKALDVAAEADVVVAVHAGYWGDFRDKDPKHMLSFAPRRRDVRFDLFHLGMPMIRDAILIGKSLPNVTLNLVWCPIISQVQTVRALNEIIDMVPINKIIAFGGDYRVCVQKVYGHLVIAREAVSAVLAKRIEQGDFDREYAMHLAELWFYDNPVRIYNIGR